MYFKVAVHKLKNLQAYWNYVEEWNVKYASTINELHFTWYIEHMSRICENFMQASTEKVTANWLEDPWIVSAQQPRDIEYGALDHWMTDSGGSNWFDGMRGGTNLAEMGAKTQQVLWAMAKEI